MIKYFSNQKRNGWIMQKTNRDGKEQKVGETWIISRIPDNEANNYISRGKLHNALLHWIVLCCSLTTRWFVPFLWDPRIRESGDEGKHIFYGNVSSTFRHIRPRIDKRENIVQCFSGKRHYFHENHFGSRSGGNFCNLDKSWNYPSTCLIRPPFMLMMPWSFAAYNTSSISVASKQRFINYKYCMPLSGNTSTEF